MQVLKKKNKIKIKIIIWIRIKICVKKKKKRKKTHYNARLSVIASNKLAFMPISSN